MSAFHRASDQTAPWVASNGTDYFVAFQDQRNASSDIYGARVTSAGVVTDPAGIPICNDPFSQSAPSVAFGGGNYQVVWGDDRNERWGEPPWSVFLCSAQSV